jgi:hypothetical protein
MNKTIITIPLLVMGYDITIITITGWWFQPTPLKNMKVRWGY